MFKSKGAVYLLIPLNIFIWGFFIYRFYTSYTEGDIPLAENKMQAVKLDELKDSVSYKLTLNYKDPFLREGEKSKRSSTGSENRTTGNTQVQKSVPVLKTPTVTAPKTPNDIKYLGLVKNNSTGVSTALISFNGASHLVKKGDIINGITIKTISNESIEIKEGKETLIISKN